MKPRARHACEVCPVEGATRECSCKCQDCEAARKERRRLLNEARKVVWGEGRL